MSNQNLIGVYLRQEDEDLREALKDFSNAAKTELVKKALRVYLSSLNQTKVDIAFAPAKPWINRGRNGK